MLGCARRGEAGRAVVWCPNAEQCAHVIAAIAVALFVLTGCGDDDVQAAPGGATAADTVHARRDAGSSDAAVQHTAVSGADAGRTSHVAAGPVFNFNDFAVADDDAGRRTDAGPPAPSNWTCKPAQRRDGRCDCGCGAADPDCDHGGCLTGDCFAADCDVCHDGAGKTVACHAPDPWTCAPARRGDGTCDCGCGAIDPDCGKLGCAEPGCYAAGCGACVDSHGKAFACERGACPAGFDHDGVCDCGCREHDPECASARDCVEPGCSADGCARCHDTSGSAQQCADWACSLERQGGADGCNCGCGAPDADCAAADGCSQPGCTATGCVTCRSAQGAPMSCKP